MAQVDYMNRVQQEARNKYQLKKEEQIEMETFRKRLENFFQNTLSKQYPDLPPHAVRLKCYGSLNNGFGLAGCDMDLLLALPDDFTPVSTTSQGIPKSILPSAVVANASDTASTTEDGLEPDKKEHIEIGWVLEGGLLDANVGARLLTKTRVPILKICEAPTPELLQNLRQYRIEQTKSGKSSKATPSVASTVPPSLDMKALDAALSQLGDQDSAANIALPVSPPNRPGASLEFDGDFGIKCDVNFSNSVAVHNTRLLREYCLLDPRVAQVGVFLKTWAKVRDINTPYFGTLSSYGYVLMVLHFLMNIASPPVIPNLQHLGRDQDAWAGKTDIDLFEGKYDIRFLSDKEKIRDYQRSATANKDSSGMLIRNLFWYYSNKDGFNWKNDVISIRTKGGILRKFGKGWTEAKWSEKSDKKNVRLRYLVAIEDPFETEHNVGRVVGHNGIVAIRDEFRRAWDILSRIGTDQPSTEDLMKQVEGRGDTLRKDQDHHRERMKQMRLAAEAKERELKEAAAKENIPTPDNGTSSDNESPIPPRNISGNRRSSNTKLTQSVGTFQDKPWMIGRRVRKVKDESDDEADDDKSNELSAVQNDAEKMSDKSVDEDPEPFCSPEEINAALGLDVWGKVIAWDCSTQDGRWLQWRDNKVRDGTWTGVFRPDMVELNRLCPFDPRRPKGIPPAIDVKPPFPMNKYELEGTTAVTESYNAFKNKRDRRRSSATKPREVPNANTTESRLTPPLEPPEDDERVNVPIRWNRWTIGGHWLQKRDAMLRAGMLVVADLDEWHARLHAEFPYNPTMLKSKLHEYNHELRKNWKSEPLDVKVFSDEVEDLTTVDVPMKEPLPKDLNDKVVIASKVSTSLDRPVQEVEASQQISQILTELKASRPADNHHQVRKLISQVLSEMKDIPTIHERKEHSLAHVATCAHQLTQGEKSIIAATTSRPTIQDQAESEAEVVEEKMPDPAEIRSMRLAHFAQLLALSKLSDGDGTRVSQPNVRTLMKEAGIDIDRPELTKKDPAIAIWDSSNSEDVARAKKTPFTQQLAQSSAITTETQLADSANTEQKVIAAQPQLDLTTSTRVPSTLYPGVSSDSRPKDQDPQIMPIPRTTGFRFDARQLRDLAIIKEGGNGCARAGQEFEIEEDYEWGGGGEMGYRSTSGWKESSGMDLGTYEYGKGDQEGLLNELPGIEE